MRLLRRRPDPPAASLLPPDLAPAALPLPPAPTHAQRYSAACGMQPLIVRGPGAGAEVTAGGVFSDVLRLAAYLGAPS